MSAGESEGSGNYEDSDIDDDGNSYSPDVAVSKRSRLSKERDRTDRISALPESVILHILSFLPTLDSVKTGVLSRSWQYLWTRVPTLNFDANNTTSVSSLSHRFDFCHYSLDHFDPGNYVSPLSSVEEEFSALPVTLSGFTYLKTVKFFRFWNGTPDFQLVQILLKNAKVLQKMIIHTDTGHCNLQKELFKAAQKLLGFQRASPNAEIFFYE